MSPFENPTQAIGVTAFGMAAMSCLLAGKTGNWPALAGVHLIFAAEIVIGLRHRTHMGIDYLLQSAGVYAARSVFQILLLGAMAFSVVWLAGRFVRRATLRQARRAEHIAWVATILTAGLFGAEIISLHAIDAHLYARTGGVMSIAWLWLTGATVVAFCALFAKHGNARMRKS